MHQFPISGPMLIDVEQLGEICVLHCRGRFVAGQDQEYIQSKMKEIKKLDCSKVIADFREVHSIGSTGLTFLLNLYTSVARKPGGGFVLVGARPLVQHVLELTRLDTVIPLAADLASGFAALHEAARSESEGISGQTF